MALAERFPRLVLASLVVLAPIPARAADAPPHAEVVGPDALAPEPTPHELEIALGGRYTRVVDRPQPDRLNGLTGIGTFELGMRTLVGTDVTYVAGLDAHVGGSDTGAAYGATVYPVGVGVRASGGAFVALAGGLGGDRVVGSVPFGVLFPFELSFSIPLGPLRPIAWVRPAWVLGATERKDGSPLLGFVDQLDAGLSIRLGKQQRYWGETNAGRGPAIGVVYSELMGARALGFTLSLALSGGR
jgi:hypothetical protein